jgi:hypothetical protein
LAVCAAFFAFFAFLAGLLPWGLADLDAVRPYIDPAAKRLFLIVGTVVLVGLVVVLVVQIGIALGWLAALYGREKDGRVWLATPLGLLGYWKQSLRLSLEPLNVRFVAVERPAAPFLSYGPQHGYISQRGKVVHMSTVGRYDPNSAQVLSDWLAARGIAASFEAQSVARQVWG